MVASKKNILFLTLVHPDLLPPVYAMAGVIRDEGFNVHILTFDSPIKSETDLGPGITIESVGRHHGLGLTHRLSIRRKYTARAHQLAAESPVAIVSFCAFSYLCGLKIHKQIPLVYHALEMSDFQWGFIKRSPLSMLNNLLAIKRMHKAGLVTTPSPQRSAWLAGRCQLDIMPQTILNTVYLPSTPAPDTTSVYNAMVPAEIRSKKTILYMGSINAQNCVMELMQAFCTINDPGSALLIAGLKDNPYSNELRAYVATSDCADRILLFPFIGGTEKQALQSNTAIGVCLARESSDPESKMTAQNKVGEYLAKGLFVLGSETEYMKMFGLLGLASLAAAPTPESITIALKAALKAIDDKSYEERTKQFVNNFYNMRQQAKPVLDFISGEKNI